MGPVVWVTAFDLSRSKLGTLDNAVQSAPPEFLLTHLEPRARSANPIAKKKFGVALTFRLRGRDCVRLAATYPNPAISGSTTNSLNVLALLRERNSFSEIVSDGDFFAQSSAPIHQPV